METRRYDRGAAALARLADDARSLESAVDELRRNGAEVEIVHPDEATLEAFGAVGGNLLDPAVREPAARAGREQPPAVAVGAGVR